MSDKILSGVKDYYTGKVKEHGVTPQGVDWNSKESQYTRFEQLSRIITEGNPFSILDYGCGYGELYNYLKNTLRFADMEYFGFDISDEMIRLACESHKGDSHSEFNTSLPDNPFDYVVASGIFNVKLELADDEQWKEYILRELGLLNRHSERGFAFNCLTSYSDTELMKSHLYYADPLFFFDFCKKHYSRNVALLHDYNLYEFTILVRK